MSVLWVFTTVGINRLFNSGIVESYLRISIRLKVHTTRENAKPFL